MTHEPTNSSPMPDDPRHTPAAELAALYAAGLLSPEEQRELESRLARSDRDMQTELGKVRLVVDALLDAPAVASPPALRAAIAARLDEPANAEVDSRRASERARAMAIAGISEDLGGSSAADPIAVRRTARGAWRPTGLPGVWQQKLYADRKSNRLTLLIKCDPGAYIPDHEHDGLEELVVLEGDLKVGELLLKVGDYFRAQPGAEHGELVSPSGCVCLLFTSYATLTAQTRAQMFVAGIARFFARLLGRA